MSAYAELQAPIDKKPHRKSNDPRYLYTMRNKRGYVIRTRIPSDFYLVAIIKIVRASMRQLAVIHRSERIARTRTSRPPRPVIDIPVRRFWESLRMPFVSVCRQRCRNGAHLYMKRTRQPVCASGDPTVK